MVATMSFRVFVLSVVLSTHAASAVAGTPLDEAVRLQREGRNRDAQRALRALLPDLRISGDRHALGRALNAVTDASIALGEYEQAILEAREAFDIHQRLGQRVDAARVLNAAGLANLYLGRYAPALDSYQRALALDRAGGDRDGEILRLNNIANVHSIQGRYADALRLYQDALTQIDTASAGALPRLRKMTVSNLAVLHQRLGADERALALYAQLRTGESMQPSEEAQLLVNEGALFRRLGDPLKAIETYRQAQTRFARAQHPDGEISAWRNIGIVFALDLEDSGRALEAFSAALQLARRSSNRRGEVQALLYRGETLRRMGRLAEAHTDLRAALDGATSAGLSEEQWKALYSVGRALEADGHADEARHTFEQAIGIIETIRTDLRTFALRSEFLADRRDVYDALIALRLSEDSAAPDEVFPLLERSRARTWQDRMRSEPEPHSLREIQRTMAQGELLLEYWTSAAGSALVWAASTTAGIVKQARSADESQAIQALSDRVSQPGDSWRAASITAGRTLLSGLPDLRAVTRLIVIPDGLLHFVPFEALTIPGTNDLVIEQFAVSYLPSSTFLVSHGLPQTRRWKWPWQRELVAFGDPPPSVIGWLAARTWRNCRTRPKKSAPSPHRCRVRRNCIWALPPRNGFLAKDCEVSRCSTSARTRSPTHATPRGPASCSRRQRPGLLPTICSCERSTTSTSPACSWPRCPRATPNEAK